MLGTLSANYVPWGGRTRPIGGNKFILGHLRPARTHTYIHSHIRTPHTHTLIHTNTHTHIIQNCVDLRIDVILEGVGVKI